MNRKYTKELLEPIVAQSTSVAQVVKALGLQPTGGNHANISKRITEFGLDRSHFMGQGHMKGKRSLNHKPITYYLSNKGYINSARLRDKLFNENYFERRCYKCNRKTWLGKPIPLELHHIDCNHQNNSLDNLTIQCPNCHYLTHHSGDRGSRTHTV